MQWYEELKENYPNWIVIERYVDDGITGTQAKKRPEFMRMIDDAKLGKFDLIVTREVSRLLLDYENLPRVAQAHPFSKEEIKKYLLEFISPMLSFSATSRCVKPFCRRSCLRRAPKNFNVDFLLDSLRFPCL